MPRRVFEKKNDLRTEQMRHDAVRKRPSDTVLQRDVAVVLVINGQSYPQHDVSMYMYRDSVED